MFRPQPFLRLPGVRLPAGGAPGGSTRSAWWRRPLALIVSVGLAAPLYAPPAASEPQEEPPRAYTDEDLKPPRPAPPQPQSQPQTQPQSRPVPPPGAGKPTVASTPPAQAGPQTAQAPAGLPAPGAPAAPPPGGAPKWPGPDAWTQEWKKGEEDRAYWSEKVRDAEDEIARLERRIDYLERKKASIQNPFLPRPLLTEEDRAAEEGLDGTARLARADGQIADARLELERARRDLEKARALAGVGRSDPTH